MRKLRYEINTLLEKVQELVGEMRAFKTKECLPLPLLLLLSHFSRVRLCATP